MFVATTEKVYCIDSSKSPLPTEIRCTDHPKEKNRKPVAAQSELGHVLSFELKLELVRNQGNKLTVGRFALGVGNRVAEESLQGIQVAPIPGDLDGVADGPLHSGRRGTEGFCDLRVQYLGDGVRAPDGPRRGFQGLPKSECDRQQLIAFFIALFATASQGLTI